MTEVCPKCGEPLTKVYGLTMHVKGEVPNVFGGGQMLTSTCKGVE